MTKQEFIQEAALRPLVSRFSVEDISFMARKLADEI